MREALLDLLRCPFCGSRLTVVENEALVRAGGHIESGVLGCDCCAFPIVAGIPVMIADDTTRTAMHQMEAGEHEQALFTLLDLDDARGTAFRALLASGRQATYRDALAILSLDAEADCFLYRFSDPTYRTTQALLRALGQNRWTVSRPVLDLCGGSGHLTRVLASLAPAGRHHRCGRLLLEALDGKAVHRRLNATRSAAMRTVRCRSRTTRVSMVVLADAFPYIWHKRMLAERDDAPRRAGRGRRDAASAQLARRELLGGHDAHARRATRSSSRHSSRGCSATSVCIGTFSIARSWTCRSTSRPRTSAPSHR